MGPFMRSSNTKFKTEVYIIICLTLLTLFSTYKSISTYPNFELHSFYPLIMFVTSILCSIVSPGFINTSPSPVALDFSLFLTASM